MHKSIKIAQELISIPSVNPMGKNLLGDIYSERQIANFIKNRLESYGVECEFFGSDPVHPNLLCKIDNGKHETIILEGHMDTVSHENMIIDPFDPKIENGLLYGRGSCDTKGSIATYLYAISKIINKINSLKKNIILLFLHDEEYSFGGAREFTTLGIKADYAIIGEPTSLNIINAHKGVCRFFLTTKGTSCHAALPWLGKNAIYNMAKIINRIEAYSNNILLNAHKELGPATINVGKISGGQTVNTVPSECIIEIDHRLLPEMNFEFIKKSLSTFLKDETDWEISQPYLEAPGMYNNKESKSCQEVLTSCKLAGANSQFQTAHYGTDASILNSVGLPCVVFGPGSVDLAHTNKECIPVKEIEKASEIILNLLTN